MADELDNQEEVQEPKKKQGLSLIAIIGIIVGFLVVQVAAIYLILPMVLKPDSSAESGKKETKEKKADSGHEEAPAEEEEDGPHVVHKLGTIIPVTCGDKDEMIINPRGSSTRYVIVSVGLEMQGEAEEEEGGHGEGGGNTSLMIPVCDKIISTISSKTLEELQEPLTRDSLRLQLRRELQPYFGEKRIRTVYFPRFIIQ